jgi:hypothetical protein
MAKRMCGCGCGASLAGRRTDTTFVNDTHRKRAERRRAEGETAAAPAAPDEPAPVARRPGRRGPAGPTSSGFVTRDEADRRKAVAQAEHAELELARDRGDLVPVRDLEDRVGRFVASTRAQLLAVIGDVRQELPGLTREQVAKVDAIVRRRLDITAAAGERGEL